MSGGANDPLFHPREYPEFGYSEGRGIPVKERLLVLTRFFDPNTGDSSQLSADNNSHFGNSENGLGRLALDQTSSCCSLLAILKLSAFEFFLNNIYGWVMNTGNFKESRHGSHFYTNPKGFYNSH